VAARVWFAIAPTLQGTAVERFTISLEDKLAHEFDHWIADRGYATRSEAVRDLLRGEVERARQHEDASSHCIACLSYVFNHHERDLMARITELQHDHHDLTVSTMHAHLDHDHCLETVILRGPTREVRGFADAVSAERGVHHGKLNLISMEQHQPHRHGRGARQAPHVHLKPAT
jgi:CopG family nickel-responsive transcriptional regulator